MKDKTISGKISMVALLGFVVLLFVSGSAFAQRFCPRRTPVITLGPTTWLSNAGGYVPNSSSPVVGGWVDLSRGGFVYFGDVFMQYAYSKGSCRTSEILYGGACPNNTAQIKIGGGYHADNGKTYGGGTTYVCVNTDTGSGQYGGE